MKTTDFDHIIRNVLLNEAENDGETTAGKEKVWQKVHPSKRFTSKQLYTRSIAAAIIALFLTIGFFSIQQSNPAIIANDFGRIVSLSKSPAPVNRSNSIQIVYRDRILASETIHDTLVITKTDPVYITVVDTVYAEKQEPLIASDNALMNQDWMIEIPQKQEVRGILWWRKKPLNPENVAEVNVPIEARGGIFMHLFGRNN